MTDSLDNSPSPIHASDSLRLIQSFFSVPELDVPKVQNEIRNGYINAQWHPSGALQILNYSQKTQYEWRWNKETLSCRGLIVDQEFKIVARPLPKFFSFEQLGGNVPDEPFHAFEKLDGSMGVLYWLDGKPAIATRGSFDSPQATKATEMLSKYDANFDNRFTYIFEIVYPENRIVVDYGSKEDLILLAVVETNTGREMPLPEIGMPIATQYDIANISDLLTADSGNREGFVVRFQSGQRVKFKFDEYKRLHKLLTGIGEKHIWEILRAGDTLDNLIERMPDEFHLWVRETENDLLQAFAAIEAKARAQLLFSNDRKKLAEQFALCEHPSVMFAILDGKNFQDVIWKKIKPSGQTVFNRENNDANL